MTRFTIMTRYDYIEMIQYDLNEACNKLNPEDFQKLLDDLRHMLDDYE